MVLNSSLFHSLVLAQIEIHSGGRLIAVPTADEKPIISSSGSAAAAVLCDLWRSPAIHCWAHARCGRS